MKTTSLGALIISVLVYYIMKCPSGSVDTLHLIVLGGNSPNCFNIGNVLLGPESNYEIFVYIKSTFVWIAHLVLNTQTCAKIE